MTAVTLPSSVGSAAGPLLSLSLPPQALRDAAATTARVRLDVLIFMMLSLQFCWSLFLDDYCDPAVTAAGHTRRRRPATPCGWHQQAASGIPDNQAYTPHWLNSKLRMPIPYCPPRPLPLRRSARRLA